MWLNMRPYINQPFNPVAVPYTIGISGANDMIDQKRNVIRLKPGTQVLIRIIPRLIKTTEYFNGLTLNQRRCKLPTEIDGLEHLKIYSRIGCETDCAIQNAISVCHCIPWHYPNSFETLPICELFGGFCFDFFMSLSITYTTCKYKCLKNCEETEYIVLPEIFPLDSKSACQLGSFHFQHFEHAFGNHFSFQSYKALIEGKSINDLAKSFANGTLCQEYVESYVAYVSVESPTSAGILTNKDKRIFFYDGLSTVGAHYALFTGMSLLSMAEIVILIVEIAYHLLKLLNPKEWLKGKQKNPDSENIDSKMCQLQHALKVSNIFYFNDHSLKVSYFEMSFWCLII